MNCYMILLILVIILTIIFNKIKWFDHLKQSKKYINIIFVILALFLAMRGTRVGVDLDNYEEIFGFCHDKSFAELLTFERHEVGFKYYNKIISLIFNNYSFYLAITAIVSIAGVYYYIKTNSKNYIYSIFIFITFNYYAFLFGLLRQAIAISILMFSIKYIKERKLIKFLLLVILASLFHKTALIFLPLYFISKLKINKKILIIWLVLILLLLVFGRYIVDFIFAYIYQPSRLEEAQGQGISMLLLLTGISLFTFYKQKELLEQDKYNQIHINSLFIATLIQCIAISFSLAHRTVMYYMISLMILIPNIIETYKDKEFKLCITSMMYIALTLYYFYMTANLIEYRPYSTIFFK